MRRLEDELVGEFTLIGDSAGANLAAAVSLRLRDNQQKIPAKQTCFILLHTGTHDEETKPF